jgi:membrane associated rhomboid family serine protease
MGRFAPSGASYSFGPGPVTPAVRAILIANIGVFLVTVAAPSFVVNLFGLVPHAVLGRGYVWQLGTYLFVHSPTSLTHILFNMLAVWMFGVDLERRWGTRAFTTYYFVTGVGAGVSVVLISLLPFADTRATFYAVTIGASGAVYGLLLAWAVLFPHRPILFMLLFPIPARVYALIMGALAFFAAVGAGGGPVSNIAHLGGLVVGWFYLKGPTSLRVGLRYRLTKWRMDRMRRRFNVHKGGRSDWENRIH